MSRIVLCLALALFASACSKKAELQTSPRKDGWTDEIYSASVDSCKESVQSAISVSEKVARICICYADSLASQFTVEELNQESTETQKKSEDTLHDCGKKENENLRFGIRSMRSFIRLPQGDDNVPKVIKNTLKKIKSDKHAREESGLNDPRLETLPPAPKVLPEIPRPEAPKTEDKKAPSGKGTFTLSGYASKKVEFDSVSCELKYDRKTKKDKVLITFFDSKNTKESAFVHITDYEEDTHHFPENVVIVYMLSREDRKTAIGFFGTTTKKEKIVCQVTNLELKDGTLSGDFSGPLTGEGNKLNTEGAFSCPVTDTRKK